MYKFVLRSALAGIGLSILFANTPVQAGGPSEGAARHHAQDQAQEFSSRRKARRHVAYGWRHRYVRSAKRGRYVYRSGYAQRARYAYRARYVHRRGSGGGSVSLAGVVGPLAAKARQIMSACGSRVVSAVRPGGHSHHSTGNAVDLQGNPTCIYSMLRGWPGGVTTDYATAPGGAHVHVSYAPGGREWGLRFAHGSRSYARVSSRARRAYARAYGEPQPTPGVW